MRIVIGSVLISGVTLQRRPPSYLIEISKLYYAVCCSEPSVGIVILALLSGSLPARHWTRTESNFIRHPSDPASVRSTLMLSSPPVFSSVFQMAFLAPKTCQSFVILLPTCIDRLASYISLSKE
jgi:hypothetical protein